MIYINPDTDIFILSDNKIQVRKLDFERSSAKILEIEGEDTADLTRIIPEIWKKGITKQQFIDFFEGKYSEIQIDDTIKNLMTAGVLSGEEIRSGNFLLPFYVGEMSGNLFFFRIDCSIFIVKSENKNNAWSEFRKIARRWSSESDLNVFNELLNTSLLVFPARRIDNTVLKQTAEYLPCHADNSIVVNFKIIRVNQALVLKKYDPFQEAREAIIDPESYWGKFITRTIDNSGLIASAQKMKVESGPFQLNKELFAVTHVLTDLKGKAVNDSQLGMGDTYEDACGKAVMESLERYCCGKRPEKLIQASVSDLSASRIINPDYLAHYTANQLDKVRDLKNFRENDSYFWTKMLDMNGESWLIPACHIWYCFYHSDFVDGRSLFWASTNGAAAHFSFEQAALSATRELIERDAIMVWWLNRLSPPTINHSFLNRSQIEIIDKIENCGFEVKLLNITMDLLPVALAVARSKKNKKPYFFSGASCHENLIMACEKALQELEQTIWSRLKNKVIKIDPKEISFPLDHEMFFLNPENRDKLNFLFEGLEQNLLGESMNLKSLRDLSMYLKNKGFQLFLKNITCEEIKEAKLGIYVVKAVIPGLIPITFGFMTETLGMRRIYDLPVKLGLRKKRLNEFDLLKNYQPHFFP